MKDEENIKELLAYFQTTEKNEFLIDKEAIEKAFQKNNGSQSLAIRILSILGGLLASLTFIGFLFLAKLYDSDIGLLIFGTLCIAGAIWINKVYYEIIMDTLSVSVFTIGFILWGLGLNKLHVTENSISIVFILIAISSLYIVQNYILSFLAILIINGSILAIIISNKNFDLILIYVSFLAILLAYLFLHEAKIISINKAISKLYNPLRIGLIFSFLSGLIIFGKKGILPVSNEYIWVPSVIIISTIIYLLSYLFEILEIIKTNQKISISVFCFLLLLLTVLSPAISGSILIVLLSFFVNYKTGFVIGITALIYSISQYYYDLNFTLLTKSILLFSSGVIFTTLYLFTHKKLTPNEKT